MSEENTNKKSFKYNVAFYYQSTIIYFIAFVLYVVIRGEFIEGSFTIITKDPIIHFFAIIVLIAVISLLYNIFKNRHLEIDENGILFIDRFKSREFSVDKISSIRITNSKDNKRKEAFKFIIIKIKGRKRPLILRAHDYENSMDLLVSLKNMKKEIDKK